MNGLDYRVFCSPLGDIVIAGQENTIQFVDFQSGKRPLHIQSDWTENHNSFNDAIKQLGNYFGGERFDFNCHIKLDGTEFQRSVWDALIAIPYGTTLNYAQIAVKIGNPKAVRAVGTAIGRNPVSLFIPCHRVIGSNGSLTGYAGGINIKQALLQLEGALIA